ncbi:MAG TPA: hypothetical protein VMH91_01270 [Candidatus Paceibacterota bacterium]|nr:hypothetical protein [Candidatus Paceibacterota bacterium]
MGNPEQPSWTNKKGWARAEDAEKLLGPEEVQRIRDKRKQERETLSSMDKIVFAEYYEHVKELGGVFAYTYNIDKYGNLIDPGDGIGPDLLSCSPSEAKNIEGRLAYCCTAEDIRAGAAALTRSYPDMEFSFEEDRTKRTLAYTVTLKKEEGPGI